MTSLSKDEILAMATKAGFLFSDKGYGPDVLHTDRLEYSSRCYERFATLCRADLETKVSALVPVVEQLVEALCELVQSDGLPRTLEQLDASVKKAFAAIAAGQTFIKESKHA